MTIDPVTGVVNWIPTQAGNPQVTFRLTNSAGTATILVGPVISVEAKANILDHIATMRARFPVTQTPLSPDTRHEFRDEVRGIGDVTHVRLNIYPDGGVVRLRLYGAPAIRQA